MSSLNSAPEHRVAQEKVEPVFLRDSVVIDRQTLVAIFGKGSGDDSARFPKTYNTNNGWVNLCDEQGNLRAMPFDREASVALSEAGYKIDPKISVVDTNTLTDIKRIRQEGGNNNFARGLEEGLMRAFEAGQARLKMKEGLDEKYSV